MNNHLQTHLECVNHCKVLLKKKNLLIKVVIFLCETSGSLKQQTIGEIYWGGMSDTLTVLSLVKIYPKGSTGDLVT